MLLSTLFTSGLLALSSATAIPLDDASLHKRASLQQVQNFGSNPSGIKMFLYVPQKLAAKPAVVRIAPAVAGALGVADGDPVAVRGPASSITLPVAVTPMVPDVVWLPAMIDGMPTAGRLGAAVGDRVHIDSVLGDPAGGVAL